MHVVVGAPGVVAAVVVALHVEHAFHVAPVDDDASEARDGTSLVAALELVEPDRVAYADVGYRDLHGVEVIALAESLGHCGVEAAQHVVSSTLNLDKRDCGGIVGPISML